MPQIYKAAGEVAGGGMCAWHARRLPAEAGGGPGGGATRRGRSASPPGAAASPRGTPRRLPSWPLLDSKAARGVEQVGVLRGGPKKHFVARAGRGAAVAYHGEGLLLHLDEEFGLGAHRLDHHHFGRDAGGGELEMLRADAVFQHLTLNGCSSGRYRPLRS